MLRMITIRCLAVHLLALGEACTEHRAESYIDYDGRDGIAGARAGELFAGFV
eukprot:gene901-5918_t